jgi:hypothetical protein
MNSSQTPRLLRLKQIVGDPKSNPPIEPIIPISRASWYDGIRKGKYPKPIKFGDGRASFWRSDEVFSLADGLEAYSWKA